jgi:hypothetical protein
VLSFKGPAYMNIQSLQCNLWPAAHVEPGCRSQGNSDGTRCTRSWSAPPAGINGIKGMHQFNYGVYTFSTN